MDRAFRVVVLGGDAAGMSAASQVKRRMKSAEVIVLEKGEDVSYGACGMPYNIGYKGNINDLVVMSAEDFRRKRGIDVRLLNEAIGVDVKTKSVAVRNHATGRQYEISFDKLFIGTGARANVPPIDIKAKEGVFTLKVLDDARKIKAYIDSREPSRALLIGGGFINLELAENLKRLGMDVIILEKLDDILPGYERELVNILKAHLEENGVKLITGVDVLGIDEKLIVKTNKGDFEADFVNIAAGITPNTDFLKDSPIVMQKGAIDVDRYFKTSVEDVYAGGDCAMIYHRLLDRNVYMPLGTNANKAGRLAGANMVSAGEPFAGIVGTTLFKCFSLGVAKTGLSLEDARNEGYDAESITITAPTKAHGYPQQGSITLSYVFDLLSGRLLGAQMVGSFDAIWRVDVLASALYAQMTIRDIQGLDLAYSPPFAPVWDPILVCANQAIKRVGK